MGIIASKEENRYVRVSLGGEVGGAITLKLHDRVQLRDGLKPLLTPHIATAGNGRNVFLLGDKKARMLPFGGEVITFTLDCVDLLRNVRNRIEEVGDFFDFGILVGFYALDERNLVIIDYNERQATLRQRIITIDSAHKRAVCCLQRGHHVTERGLFFVGRTTVSDDMAVTIAPRVVGRVSPVVLIYPKNPLDKRTKINATSILVEASSRLHESSNSSLNISAWDAPFFLSSTQIGFFTDAVTLSLTVNPILFVAVDFVSREIKIVRSIPDTVTNFPYAADGSHPIDFRTFQGSHDQLGMLVSFRCPPNNWRRMVASVIEKVSSWFFHLFIAAAQRGYMSIGGFFLSISVNMAFIKFGFVRPSSGRMGIMCTRTMQWREQSGAASPSVVPIVRACVFPNGNVLLYDKTKDSRIGSRSIGCTDSDQPPEELRVIANLNKPSSLKSLAEFSVRKTRLATHRTMIDQIAARI